MKSLLTILSCSVVLLIPFHNAKAEQIDWADYVNGYSANIQNYGGDLMTAETTGWLTGPPNADSTHDYVAGWRAATPDEYIVMGWNEGIPDSPGHDLLIHLYAGPKASADVFASTNGVAFTLLDTMGGGMGAGNFFDATFDFAGQFSGDVYYVKVVRTAVDSGTGMFFDAFGGISVPEPSGYAMVFVALAALLALPTRKRLVIRKYGITNRAIQPRSMV